MSNKRTLLDIVQEILSDMDGDEVNGIDDTIEATQVAEIVRSTYQAMLSNRNWPHSKKFVTLTASGSSSLPVHLTLSGDIKEVVSLQYDKVRDGETRKKWQTVKYIDNDAFLRLVDGRNSDSASIDIITDTSGAELLIINDQPPQYYTSFDDDVIIFDSYDSAVDTTVQSSKARMLAYTMLPSLEMLDDAIPDLPEEAFTSLIEESKSKSMFKLKQFNDPKAEQESQRQRTWLSRKAYRVDGGWKYPDYGRKR